MQLKSHLVVGATVDYRDGFVGCMRGLMVNGHHLDMRAAALTGIYGIGIGCTGKCDSDPCLNNGTCHEGYDRYICDCRFTSFKGIYTIYFSLANYCQLLHTHKKSLKIH